MNYVIKTREELAAKKAVEKMALASIVRKIAARVPGLRITPYSIGIMKATCRGGWIDGRDEWSFYTSGAMPDATVEAIKSVVPAGVQVYTGAIHFPSSFAA